MVGTNLIEEMNDLIIIRMILHTPSFNRESKLDEKDLFKHTLLEPLSFDIEKIFHDNNEIHENEPTFLLVHFDPSNEKPTFYFNKTNRFSND